MNFIKFYADSRTSAREKFVYKVQMWCRIRDDINYLDPVVCIHPRKLTFSRGPGHGMTRKENRVVRAPGRGMTKSMPAAQWIPACAGMTIKKEK